MRELLNPRLGQPLDVVIIWPDGSRDVKVKGLTKRKEAKAWQFYWSALTGNGTKVKIVPTERDEV